MKDRKHLGTALIVLSVCIAVGILAVLILVATASTPDRFRELDANARYLERSLAAVAMGIEAAESQRALPDEKIGELDRALERGRSEIVAGVRTIYRPDSMLDRFRIPLMELTNVIDSSAAEFTDATLLLETVSVLHERVEATRTQLHEFSSAHAELTELRASFDAAVTDLVGSLRERGMAGLADSFYVLAGQIRGHVKKGAAQDLDNALQLAGDLRGLEGEARAADKPLVREMVNRLYTMVSVRRSMAQAVSTMDVPGLRSFLGELRGVTTRDQLYVLQSVNDARVLLNVYTMLLLLVLGFFGIRLRASHAALNRSHDDLEQRVVDRTHDLEQANTELKESQVQLVQAEKMSSLGQLVAGVMHEINTPLLYVLNNTTVTAEAVQDLSSYLDATLPVMRAKNSDEGKNAIKHMLARRSEFDVDEIVENIEEIESLADDSIDGLNQIGELVQSLKDFSRLDRVANDRFDVREGIEKTLTITRNLLKNGIEVKKDLREVPEIQCSPSRLNQVLINLVTNAVQAMEGEGELRVATSTHGDTVEIIIEDSGCGIPQEDLDKVMDPFFTTKPVGEGTGLGLSIVRQIIDQHDGQILIDSKVGRGTRVTISLPIAGPQDAEREEEAA